MRRGREILGVSVEVASYPDQLRVVDNFHSRHSREASFVGIVLTELRVVHFRFPSPDRERVRVQCGLDLTPTRVALLSISYVPFGRRRIDPDAFHSASSSHFVEL